MQVDLDRQIKEKEGELARLRAQRDAYLSLSEEQRLADVIHSKLCHANHDDGCAWFYDDWEGATTRFDHQGNVNAQARLRALAEARRILAIIDFRTAMAVLEPLRLR